MTLFSEMLKSGKLGAAFYKCLINEKVVKNIFEFKSCKLDIGYNYVSRTTGEIEHNVSINGNSHKLVYSSICCDDKDGNPHLVDKFELK